MADTNHTPIVKILLDLGVADLSEISTDKDYLKALIRATNKLDPKDGRIPILQKEIQKLRAISFARGGSPRKGGQLANISPSTRLSPSTLKGGLGSDDSLSSQLSVIQANLRSIETIFRKGLELDENKAKDARKAQQDLKKKTREQQLESTGASIPETKILQKATKPVQGFLEKIMNFFKNVLMGGALLGLLKIIKNPDIILQPIKDFIDGLINFFNNVLKVVFGIIFAPINALLWGINMGIKGVMGAIDGAIRLFNPDHKSSDEVPQLPYLKAPQIPTFAKQETDNVETSIPAGEGKEGVSPVPSGGVGSGGVTGKSTFRSPTFSNMGGKLMGGDSEVNVDPQTPLQEESTFRAPTFSNMGGNLMSSGGLGGSGGGSSMSLGGSEGSGGGSSMSLGGSGGSGGGSSSSAQIASPSPNVAINPPSNSRITLVPITTPKKTQQPLNSGSSADQKTVSNFSPIDFNNHERMGVRAEYQLV